MSPKRASCAPSPPARSRPSPCTSATRPSRPRGSATGCRASTRTLLAALDQLSGDHDDLRAALSDEGGHAAAGVGALVTAHLRHEEAVYTTIAALIGPTVVDAFERDHVEIERALRDLAAHATDPAGRARAQQALATAVEEHIRLEEMVLFPLALAALARGATTSLASP